MRLVFIADGRSPIAKNWIRYFVEQEHEVFLISTFACETGLDLAGQVVVPVAFSGMARSLKSGQTGKKAGGLLSGAAGIKIRTWIRHSAGPYTLRKPASRIREFVESIRPDLVHAMRIPYEGMAAARAGLNVPLIVSVWGNDFTLHAHSSAGMARQTRFAMRHCSALHADCKRDTGLAREWGWDSSHPEIVLPGNGGVRPDVFNLHARQQKLSPRLTQVFDTIPAGSSLVVNPRGFRGYVRNDTFFHSIPLIRQQKPDVVFLCPAMEEDPQALEWLDRLNIRNAVRLLPKLTPEEMAQLFSRAQITVSPSEHDGTPNTLLEAMACGAFPIAGDLDSIREWIDHEVNGLLIDPANPHDLAAAVIRVLEDTELVQKSVLRNREIIAQRASQPQVMKKAEAFYSEVLDRFAQS